MYKIEKHFFTTIILLLLTSVYSLATEQTRLRDDIWQIIGYPGDYNTAGSGGYSTEQSREVQDRVDDLTTWLRVDDTLGLGFNDEAGYSLSFTSTTTSISSPLGFFVFSDVVFSGGGRITQEADIITIKVPNARARFVETPIYTSYYQGETGDVVLRVSYQADHSGDVFRVGFDNKNYYAHFDQYSYDKPGLLVRDNPSDEDMQSIFEIDDIFDFNISDNNLSAMRLGLFSADSITKYSSSNAYDLIVYHLSDEGLWKVFNSSNTQTNDFNALQKGRGYWVRTTNTNATLDPTGTHTGIVHASATFLPSAYYEKLPDGWNLASFDNSALVHVPTGIFAPLSLFTTGGGLNIFFSTHNRPTVATDDGNISVVADGTNIVNSTDVAQYINVAAEYNAKIFGADVNMRSFPAMNIFGESGVIILADSLFEINVTDFSIISSLAGQELRDTEFNMSVTWYGERLLGIDFRDDLNITDLNASLALTLGDTGESRVITDLNETDKLNTIRRIDRAYAAMSVAAGLSEGFVGEAYLVAVDFNASQSYENNSSFTQILIASSDSFSVRDSVFTKAFEKVGDGEFRVIGVARTLITNLTTNLTDTMEELADFINEFASDLGIIAKSVGVAGSEVLMLIGSSNNIDILENDDYTIFNDIQLDSNLILESEKNQGSINGYFTYSDILALPVNIDETLTDSVLSFDRMLEVEVNGTSVSGSLDVMNFNLNQVRDFKVNPIISPYFSGEQGVLRTLSGANKDLLSILSLEHSAIGSPYWIHTDTTKIPSRWLEEADRQGLFAIRSHSGYFIKIKELSTLPAETKELQSFGVQQENIYHFNNTLLDGIGTVSNHINHSVEFSFNSAFINPVENPYFGVFVHFLDREYSLTSASSTFSFAVDSIALGISSGKPNSDPYAITIQAYDGTGNFYEESQRPVIELDFVKPEIPAIDYTENGDLIYTTISENVKLEAYRGAISDIASERAGVLIDSAKVSTAVTWQHPFSSDFDGLIFPIRFLTLNTSSNLYSDIRTVLYAPLKNTQILIANEDNETDYYPYDLIINTQLVTNYGVGLTLYKPKRNKEIRMAYYPEVRHLESDKEPTRLAAPVYLKISKNTGTGNDPVATISYLEEYVGKRFYIFFQNKLYQGTFPELGTFNSDGAAYDLSATLLSVDDVVNNTETATGLIGDQSTQFGGIEIDPKTVHNQNIGYLPDEKTLGPLPQLLLFSKPIPTLDEEGNPYKPPYLLPE